MHLCFDHFASRRVAAESSNTVTARRLPDGSSQATVLDLGGVPFTKAGSCDEHADRDRNAIERPSPLPRQGCDEHEQKAGPLVHEVAPRRKNRLRRP